jgi:GlpG protein
MRLIGTLDDERNALAFSQFLQQKGISHQIEIQTNTDWGSAAYGSRQCQVWIYEEEQVDEALKWFQLFMKNPQDPIFRTPVPPPIWVMPESSVGASPLSSPSSPSPPTSPAVSWERQAMGWVTRTLLIICCSLFFLSYILMPFKQIPERYVGLILFTSPVEKALLYDYPKFYQLIDRFLHQYGYEELEHPQDLPEEGQRLLYRINHTPFWPGFYHLLLKEGWQGVKKGFSQYPTFEKIQEGQIWRLFSPCLLHGDLFHLFFNMLWLIVLGKQIEQRLKTLRYVIFILLIGVVSNTAQYLMSGPNFIGFSGILCGMLAFIWVRQKRAAWEGYQIDRLTLIFMLVFIIGMALLQLVSFFVEKSFDLAFSPNIANVAHLAGGLMGLLFGRLNFFSWRHA